MQNSNTSVIGVVTGRKNISYNPLATETLEPELFVLKIKSILWTKSWKVQNDAFSVHKNYHKMPENTS